MLKITYQQEEQKWDEFIATSKHASAFINTAFIKSLDVDFSLVTGSDKNGEIVIGCPVFFDVNNRVYDKVLPFTQYQGVVIKNLPEKTFYTRTAKEYALLKEFIAIIAAKYPTLTLSQHYLFNDLRPFQWYNYGLPDAAKFSFDLRYTPLLNLQNYSSYEDFFKSLPDKKKRYVEKHALQFSFSEDVSALNEMLDKTFEKQGIIRSNSDSISVRKIVQRALSEKRGKLGVVKLDEKIISATFFLYYADCAYYLFGGTDPAYLRYDAANFLMLKMIQDCFLNKLRMVDFVGANSPGRGDFKLGYNAELKPFFNIKLIDK